MKSWKARLRKLVMWLRRDPRGQSAVEFSLTVPFLALIVVGSADVARATYSFIAVTNAAANGALYGSRAPSYASDTAGISSAALADAQSLTGTAPAVTVQLATDGDGYQAVSVTVTYQMETAGWPGLPNPVQVSKTAIMRVLP